MATNIKFSAASDGSGAYTLSINPNELVLNQGGDYSEFDVLDDSPITQRFAFDGRERRMIWPGGLEVSHPTMLAQVAVLRGYIGTIRYIQLNAAAFGSFSATVWYKNRIVDVLENIRRGGRVRWESIVLIFRPEA